MRVIIAGSRDVNDYAEVEEAVVKSGFKISCVVSGACRGVDRLGEEYASHHNLQLARFPVTSQHWKVLGRKAGPMRNRRMAENADALIAIWDGKSKGTESMINIARKRGLLIYIHRV